ncbi:MAG: response regulator transcription factor [Ignavibacteriae bacterium]|nr:response regulator transcription factor [Ignavibacteriota bacterium]
MKKVLVIEDNESLSDLLEIHLKDLECDVTKIADGLLGLDKALNESFDLIVLDIMLPNLDGLEICKEVRSQNNYTPILMLTSKSEEIDKVIGLEIGADDYLTKPFSVREFIARVKAIFRRVNAIKKEVDSNQILTFGNLIIELDKRKVVQNGTGINLTAKEFDLLYLLASRPGKIYSREQLLNLLWGYHYRGYEHTVNSHINRLRSKIELDISSPKYILTSWGVGYKFNDNIKIEE